MPKEKKKTERPRRYGDYTTKINGEDFAIARLPLGNGKYKRVTIKLEKIGGTKTEARKSALNKLDEHKRGAFDKKEALGWTFIQAARWHKMEYLIPVVKERGIKIEGLTDWNKQRNKLDRMIEFFGANKLITSFTEDDFTKWARHRRKIDEKSSGVLQATINRDFAMLRTLFKRLQKRIGKSFEIPDFPINTKAEFERDRVMSFQEEAKILSHCVEYEMFTTERKGRSLTMKIKCKRQHLKPIIIVAVDTAMRQGEMMKLVWNDVDLDAGVITVHFFNAKTERTRKIGLPRRVKEELKKMFDAIGEESCNGKAKVFGMKSVYRSFDTACNRAGIDDLNFHDLRHTGTTRMVRSGIPIAEVMKITGHTQMKTFMRYLNLVNETIQSNANQLAAYLEQQTVIDTNSLNN
jgi:integrase